MSPGVVFHLCSCCWRKLHSFQRPCQSWWRTFFIQLCENVSCLQLWSILTTKKTQCGFVDSPVPLTVDDSRSLEGRWMFFFLTFATSRHTILKVMIACNLLNGMDYRLLFSFELLGPLRSTKSPGYRSVRNEVLEVGNGSTKAFTTVSQSFFVTWYWYIHCSVNEQHAAVIQRKQRQ